MGKIVPASNNDALLLYPNPASTVVNHTPGAGVLPESYIVYYRPGQVVGTGKISSRTTVIDVAAYSAGVYL
ncbi:MAG: hypothetical protein EOO45_10370 [Flavobacterium sp.]|nr:MAG: hypothetical protein EOO45_10370 [Flavobacterium sp.]